MSLDGDAADEGWSMYQEEQERAAQHEEAYRLRAQREASYRAHDARTDIPRSCLPRNTEDADADWAAKVDAGILRQPVRGVQVSHPEPETISEFYDGDDFRPGSWFGRAS